MFVASSSDTAGSSDAEYSEGDVLESAAKGEVIKEGFLMKKVIPVMSRMLLLITDMIERKCGKFVDLLIGDGRFTNLLSISVGMFLIHSDCD